MIETSPRSIFRFNVAARKRLIDFLEPRLKLATTDKFISTTEFGINLYLRSVLKDYRNRDEYPSTIKQIRAIHKQAEKLSILLGETDQLTNHFLGSALYFLRDDTAYLLDYRPSKFITHTEELMQICRAALDDLQPTLGRGSYSNELFIPAHIVMALQEYEIQDYKISARSGT